jgi:hypothetical protein
VTPARSREFGLLPEFSTPVEKPVENAGKLVVGTQKGLVLRHFSEAKARRSRFEAIFRVRHRLLTGAAVASPGRNL